MTESIGLSEHASFRTRHPNATSSRALSNLRAFVILIVLGFHSMLAYLGSLNAAPFAFNVSPYEWRAFPIVDSHRWFGFDVFCAWQDVYLMALMFFLSALFTRPSLARKGTSRFLGDRLLRLGVPFAFAVVVVMPIALYPTYRVTATDPGLLAYGRSLLALPFLPNGPMWFLWQLIALTLLAACLHRWAPRWVDRLAHWSSGAATRPGRYFIGLAGASILAYVPLALAFTPWTWSEHGPFALQLSRPLLYAVFYLAGLGVGADGLEGGLLATSGMLARRWARWVTGALGAFVLWMGLTALAMNEATPPAVLQVAVDVSFAVACASGCFCVLAVCLRFGAARLRILDSLANNAFGIYVLHYVFVVWLQYALLGVALFAIAKATIVFTGTLALAWATAMCMGFMPVLWSVVGAPRRMRLGPPPVPAGRDRLGPRDLPQPNAR
jgi:hypothetical protein